MKHLCLALALVAGASDALGSSTSPRAATLDDISVVPFEGGCLADPSEWRLRADGGVTLLVGDCPLGDGFYDQPFAETALAGNLSIGEDLRETLLALAGDSAVPFARAMQVDYSGSDRQAYVIYDRIGSTLVRAVLIAGPLGNLGTSELRQIAEDWIQCLRRRNP